MCAGGEEEVGRDRDRECENDDEYGVPDGFGLETGEHTVVRMQ